jgi:perosamine synthetase
VIPRRRTPVGALRLAAAWASSRGGASLEVRRLEEALAAFVGTAHAVAACSGRTALLATLRALGLRPGDEVLLPAYTLADLPRMLARAGLVPIFADISPGTFLLDPEAAARAVTPRTRAVLPTDLFGLPARWDEMLGDVCGARSCLIEDAAHAAGSTLDGRPAGGRCHAAFFSLETIKVWHSFGGGIVATADGDLAARIRAELPRDPPGPLFVPAKLARNAVENLAFRTPAYRLALTAMETPALRDALLRAYERVRSRGVATEAAYSSVQAAFARAELASLPARVARRRDLAARMIEALSGSIAFQEEPPGAAGNRYFLVGDADRSPEGLRRALLREGIDIGIHGEITDFCPPAAEAARFPVARRAYERLVQLPLFDSMTDGEGDRVIAAFSRAISRTRRDA